jgi:hypothetical protein
MAIFALVGGANFASERVHHVLQPIADPEHGQAEAEDPLIRYGSIVVVD